MMGDVRVGVETDPGLCGVRAMFCREEHRSIFA